MFITSNSTKSYVKREAGGKGYNLYLLTQEGLPIPRWIIIGANTFKKFKKVNNLHNQINNYLDKLKNNHSDVVLIAKSIQKIILDTPLDQTTLEEIKNAYKALGSKNIAIRSSALDEDSNRHSFAGQFDSYLGIKSELHAIDAVKKCWSSAYSERNLMYRIQRRLLFSAEDIEIGVVLQDMIQADASGVLFTCDPVKKDQSKIIISSVFGLGEGLVSGQLEADTYLLDKKDLRVIDKTIISKKTKIITRKNTTGTEEISIVKEDQNEPSLTNEELKNLAKKAVFIEKLYRFPQDIEWAIKEGEVYILQARPVTTPTINDDGFLNIWDNSNIIESYGGLTLPLTYTFARYVYHQVYIQFCEVLMVPQKEIRNMDYFLKNMLGLFYGRVYYNLLNWYKLTSILPGYKYNRGFMETMMGTSKSLESEIAERVRPPITQNKFVKTLTGLKFLYYHFVVQKQIDSFLNYFQKIYNKYRKIDYSKMAADDILLTYRELESTLLREWKAPIINDFLCMVHFGILKKLTQKWLGHLSESIQNDLLCGEGNLESAEPTKELIRMANIAMKNSKLKKMILDTPAEDCMETLNQSSFEDFKKKIDRYIDLYGYRCMNEMKLEQKDLYQDPSFLFICLKNYLQSDHVTLESIEKREKDIRLKAETTVNQNLTVFKRLLYFWSLNNARKAVKNRENTRFCRTRIYGVVRSLFYNIGRDFTLRSIIDQPEDIFYLELDEVFGTIEGTLTVQNLQSLIHLRKNEYKQFGNFEPAGRFTTRGSAYWMNDHVNKDSQNEDNKPTNGMLKGIGCCPGIVKGKVKVILTLKDTMRLNGEILVAPRTDPGWIPLYPSISGLLVERGSLLSHSAIVAREMGIPTIVGVTGLINKLQTGKKVEMNGETGQIKILQ